MYKSLYTFMNVKMFVKYRNACMFNDAYVRMYICMYMCYHPN